MGGRSPAISSGPSQKLSLIAFDLDGTLWWPEMYMMWGNGGPPFTASANGDVKDKAGQMVKLMGDTRSILADILDCRTVKLHDVKIAISSRTDEPEWAQECMEKMWIKPGHSLKSVFHLEEISKINKVIRSYD